MSFGMYDQYRRLLSKVMLASCVACSLLIVCVLAWVLGYLLKIGFGSVTWAFFTEVPKPDAADPGGMAHALVGTVVLVGLATLVGVPVGVAAGVYLSEYTQDKWLLAPVRFTADVLAGVPSIVVGILGYELLVRPLGSYNGWAGAFALAFIMVPIVARTTEEMLKLVPDSYRAASLALGATKAQTVLRVILPSATGSLVTGVMLAIARIAGETAPLLFTALGSRFLMLNPNEPFPSLTVQIYTYVTGPYLEQKKLAWAGILVLVMLLFVLNLLIRFVTSRSLAGRMA